MKRPVVYLLCLAAVLSACKHKTNVNAISYVPLPAALAKKPMCCESNIPKRFASFRSSAAATDKPSKPADKGHKGMIWVNSGTFAMGGDNAQASPDEFPKHKV